MNLSNAYDDVFDSRHKGRAPRGLLNTPPPYPRTLILMDRESMFSNI